MNKYIIFFSINNFNEGAVYVQGGNCKTLLFYYGNIL